MTIFVGCHTSLSCWDLLYMKMDLIWVCLNMGDISINKAWDQCFDKGIMVYTTNMGKPVVYRYTPTLARKHQENDDSSIVDHFILSFVGVPLSFMTKADGIARMAWTSCVREN